jgi:UDP-glucose 4-epimerase
VKTVLITGAAGFIGSKLRHFLHLGADWKIISLDKAAMTSLGGEDDERYYTNITDDESMSRLKEKLYKRVDACVHLAAVAAPREAEREPGKAWDTNVRGTHNVLSLLRDIECRKVVFASSAHVYGISPKYMPTDENHPLSLLDTYTTTKIMGEQLCDLFRKNYGINATILRLFNVFGPGQSEDYFLGKKLQQAKAGGPITLMNGGVTKDWVWIYDVVSAFDAALSTDYSGPINIGTGVETSLREMAEYIASEFKLLPLVDEPATDIGPTRMQCDPLLAKNLLNWSPSVNAKTGLLSLISITKLHQ